MRRRRGRQDGRSFRRGRVVVGIRRYLRCLRNDTAVSDTDSDSIPLNSLLDDDTDDNIDYSTAVLTQMNNDAASINPAAVCTGLMQVIPVLS